MTELDDIRTFVEVINQGGFSQAARRLGLAKSIVSRRISRLEADLGTRLINRSPRGISPTDAGMEFKIRGERILIELIEARDSVAAQRGEIVGRLRLSIALSFGMRHVARLLADWSAAHPKLEIDAAYSDRQVDLVGERFDAAIRIGVLRDSTLVARHITTIKRLVVASASYLARHEAPQTPDDLVDHECLIYSGSRERTPWQFRGKSQEFTVLPEGRFWADSGEAILQGAQAGIGIAALPAFLVAESLRDGRLIELLPAFGLPDVGLYLVRPRSAYVPAKVRELTKLLLAHFGGEPPWAQTGPTSMR